MLRWAATISIKCKTNMKTPYESIRLAHSPFLVTESMQTLASAFYEQASEYDTFVFVISLLASKEKKKCVNKIVANFDNNWSHVLSSNPANK